MQNLPLLIMLHQILESNSPFYLKKSSQSKIAQLICPPICFTQDLYSFIFLVAQNTYHKLYSV